MKFHILIVGDDAPLALVFQTLLGEQGYVVTCEPDEARAEERIQSLQPDMVVFVSPTGLAIESQNSDNTAELPLPVDVCELLRAVESRRQASAAPTIASTADNGITG